MTKNNIKIFLGIIVLLLSTIFCTTSSEPDSSSSGLTAVISETEGTVQTLKPEDGSFSNAANGQFLRVNDQLLTQRDSRVRLDLSNGTIIRVGPLSHFVLQKMEERSDGAFSKLKLEIGELFIILNGGSVDVDTPAGLASVRGSFMNVRVIPYTQETIITCLEGLCQIGNGGGAVNLVAGQSAYVENFDAAPTQGTMDDDDVAHWLMYNPEATLVILPLTATVAASVKDTATAQATATATETATPSSTACPHPENWTAISITLVDSLQSLADTYAVTKAEIASANCLDIDAELADRIILFVPATAGEPTATSAFTPTATAIAPTATSSTGSNTNAEFSKMAGPVNILIDKMGNCENLFSVDVLDADGVDYVEVEYSVNDSSFSSSTFLKLTYQGGNTYKGFIVIDTYNNPGLDRVYWRFATADVFNNHQWFPAQGATPFSYDDNIDCGAPASVNTTFANIVAPEDGVIINTCPNEFSVDVTDPDGINFVKVEYNLNDPTFGNSAYFILEEVVTGRWGGLLTIPSAETDKVYWHFWVIDGLGNYIYFPNDVPYKYIAGISC